MKVLVASAVSHAPMVTKVSEEEFSDETTLESLVESVSLCSLDSGVAGERLISGSTRNTTTTPNKSNTARNISTTSNTPSTDISPMAAKPSSSITASRSKPATPSTATEKVEKISPYKSSKQSKDPTHVPYFRQDSGKMNSDKASPISRAASVTSTSTTMTSTTTTTTSRVATQKVQSKPLSSPKPFVVSTSKASSFSSPPPLPGVKKSISTPATKSPSKELMPTTPTQPVQTKASISTTPIATTTLATTQTVSTTKAVSTASVKVDTKTSPPKRQHLSPSPPPRNVQHSKSIEQPQPPRPPTLQQSQQQRSQPSPQPKAIHQSQQLSPRERKAEVVSPQQQKLQVAPLATSVPPTEKVNNKRKPSIPGVEIPIESQEKISRSLSSSKLQSPPVQSFNSEDWLGFNYEKDKDQDKEDREDDLLRRTTSFEILDGLDRWKDDDDRQQDHKADEERFLHSPKKYQPQYVQNYYDEKEDYRQVTYPMSTASTSYPSSNTTAGNGSNHGGNSADGSSSSGTGHGNSPIGSLTPTHKIGSTSNGGTDSHNSSFSSLVPGLVTRTRQTHLVSDPPHLQNQHKTCYAWTALSMIRQARRLEGKTNEEDIPDIKSLYKKITNWWYIGNKVKGGDLLAVLQRFISENQHWGLFELSFQRFRNHFNHSDAQFCVFGITLKFTEYEWSKFDECHHYEPPRLPADEEGGLKELMKTLQEIETTVREQQKQNLKISLSEEHRKFMNYLYWKMTDYPSPSEIQAAVAVCENNALNENQNNSGKVQFVDQQSSRVFSTPMKQMPVTSSVPVASNYLNNLRKGEKDSPAVATNIPSSNGGGGQSNHESGQKSRSNSNLADVAVMQLQQQVKLKFFEILNLFPNKKFPKSTFTITPELFYEQQQEDSFTMSEATTSATTATISTSDASTMGSGSTRGRYYSTAAIVEEETVTETQVFPDTEDAPTLEEESTSEKGKVYFCHSFAVYGVDLENSPHCVIAKNSWGTSWGFIGGHCRLSFDWLRQLANERRIIFYRLSPKGWAPKEVSLK